MNTAALEASSLSRRYGGTWALRDCSLSLPTARVIALVGPNGAGKTTLLHLATGLLQPTSGTIRVLGELPGANREILGRVGFVAQEMPLYRNFTVAEMLRFGEQLNPTWDQAAGGGSPRVAVDPARTEGRHAVRWAARSGEPRDRARQAAGAAPAGRTARQPGPAGPTGLPRRADGERGGGRCECRAVVASGERPGAGLRSPGRPPERHASRSPATSAISSGPIAS